MLKIDLHSHTLNSKCGHHTLWEVINFSRERGIEVLGVTDHGPAQGATIRGTFFDHRRVPTEFGPVRLLKGLEGNITSLDGDIDLTPALLQKLDIVLVGMHPVALPSAGVEGNTQAVLNLLEKGPSVDLITHPDIAAYPLDMSRIVPAAASRGVILEINDANLFLNKTDLSRARQMVELGRRHGAIFAINSDAHTWIEFGRDDNARQWLGQLGNPAIDLISDWPKFKVLDWLAARKSARLAALAAR